MILNTLAVPSAYRFCGLLTRVSLTRMGWLGTGIRPGESSQRRGACDSGGCVGCRPGFRTWLGVRDGFRLKPKPCEHGKHAVANSGAEAVLALYVAQSFGPAALDEESTKGGAGAERDAGVHALHLVAEVPRRPATDRRTSIRRTSR